MTTKTPDRNYINEHRRAVGRPGRSVSVKEHILVDDEHRIAVFAPYGQDPWLDYRADDEFALRLLRVKDQLDPETVAWAKEYFNVLRKNKTETGT